MSGASPLLPLAGPAPPPSLGTPVDACSIDDGCITCGDVAVALRVVEADAYDARCRDETGREEVVATDLVGPVAAGDLLLVHAKVALEKLTA
ncbi:MAG: HypC/HybG/HupF family hydrogenase formation chaperone [Egibacteraceae bacterium]